MSLLETLWISRAWVRRLGIVLLHVALWCVAFLLALEIRFEGAVPTPYDDNMWRALGALLVARVVVSYAMKQFHGLWRYAGMPELKSLIIATSIGTAIFTVVGFMVHACQMPRSIYVGEWLASLVFVGGFR